jgi:hypothetical protein
MGHRRNKNFSWGFTLCDGYPNLITIKSTCLIIIKEELYYDPQRSIGICKRE